MSWPSRSPGRGRSCDGCGCDDFAACMDTGSPCYWTTSGLCSSCDRFARPDMPRNHARQAVAGPQVEALEDDFVVVLYDHHGEPLVTAPSGRALKLADLERMRDAMTDPDLFQRLYLGRFVDDNAQDAEDARREALRDEERARDRFQRDQLYVKHVAV